MKDLTPPIFEEINTPTMCSSDTQTILAPPPPPPPPLKPHFVLVHGYLSGSWCWYKVCSLMEKAGYKYSCPNLKSAGIDPTDPESLHSFDEYNQPLIDLLSNLPENEKVILVGHSAGGISVTDATHKFGEEKIKVAIYVAATMLRLGFQTDEDFIQGIPAEVKKKEEVLELKVGSDDQSPKSILTKIEFDSNVGHHVMSLTDKILEGLLNKRKGPIEAIKKAKFEETSNIDMVKRVYIKTMYDNTLKPWQQEAMINRWRPSREFELNSDHNPIFSAPDELFHFMVKAAELNF